MQTEAAGADPVNATPYAYYALGVLTCVSIFNYMDRQILSILAHSIKTDLKLDDAQLGFLLGTSFAVFYSVVGIAAGRVADSLSRKWTMTTGLVLWSSMTALGGLAKNFNSLGLARIGVGAGEATANPCAYSLLCSYFPARNRAAVLSIYVAGVFAGSALAMLVGGYILQNWNQMCGALPWRRACSLADWRAALIIVGIPGIPLAILVATLREPASEHVRDTNVGKVLLREFAATIPPFTLLAVQQAAGWRVVRQNLLVIALLAVAAMLLIGLTRDIAQWCAIAIGAYGIITWAQVQKARDPELYRHTLGCPTFALSQAGAAALGCIGGGIQAWAAPYALRTFHLTPGQVGLSIGLTVAGSGAIGLILGGWVSDKWRAIDPRAPSWIALTSLFAGMPIAIFMVMASSPKAFFVSLFLYGITMSAWTGANAALVQDLVQPRMRGTAAAIAALLVIVVSAGFGPYWAGKVSTLTGSLGTGMLSMQLLVPVAGVLILMTATRLKADVSSRTKAHC